jgi:hypothetical protein
MPAPVSIPPNNQPWDLVSFTSHFTQIKDMGDVFWDGERTLQIITNLILKLVPVDAAASPPRAGWIAALDHKVLDDAVEDGAVVVAARGEGGKVLAGLGGVVGVQLYEDRALTAG